MRSLFPVLLLLADLAHADPAGDDATELDEAYPHCASLDRDTQRGCYIDAMLGEIESRHRSLVPHAPDNAAMAVFSGPKGTTGMIVTGLDKIHGEDAYVTLMMDGKPLWASVFVGAPDLAGMIPEGYPYAIPLSYAEHLSNETIMFSIILDGDENLASRSLSFFGFFPRNADLDGDQVTDSMSYGLTHASHAIAIGGLERGEEVTFVFLIKPGGSTQVGEIINMGANGSPVDGRGPWVRSERICTAPDGWMREMDIATCKEGRTFDFPTFEEQPVHIVPVP